MASKTSQWRTSSTVCRCCLNDGCYKDISTEYFWMGKKEVYSEMLSEALNVTISYSQTGGPNSNSRLICETCITRLRDASDFKRQVLECEKMFMKHLDSQGTEDTEATPNVFEAETADTVKVEYVKDEKDLSDNDGFDDKDFGFDNDDDDDLDDEPLMKLATKQTKKESIDLIDIIKTKSTEKRKSTSNTKATTAKKAKTKDVKPSASKTEKGARKKGSVDLDSEEKTQKKRIVPLFQVEYDRTLCRPLGTIVDFSKVKYLLKQKVVTRNNYTPSRSPSPYSNDYSMDEVAIKSIEESGFDIVETISQPIVLKERPRATKQPETRENALTIFEFSTVYPFIYGNNKFKCFVCSQPFLDATLMRQHMDTAHDLAPLKRLVNNRRANVLKVDVSELTCKICLSKPSTFYDLKIHLKEVHNKPMYPDLQDNLIPFKLVNDETLFTCVICQETFIKFRLLVIHMSVHFNNYSCEICGSGFMTLRLLKKHLEVHENGNFPCDKCEKVFNTPYKRALHVRGVHLKQYPRRCPICPERFNSNYRRTIHLQDVHNQSTRVHKCETCGRGFNLKYHLLCHIRSVHLQERNQQCDVCHQRFCNKETLKRHMVIHTGEKNYKCDICGMAFLRRKNLRDHLRLHDVV